MASWGYRVEWARAVRVGALPPASSARRHRANGSEGPQIQWPLHCGVPCALPSVAAWGVRFGATRKFRCDGACAIDPRRLVIREGAGWGTARGGLNRKLCTKRGPRAVRSAPLLRGKWGIFANCGSSSGAGAFPAGPRTRRYRQWPATGLPVPRRLSRVDSLCGSGPLRVATSKGGALNQYKTGCKWACITF